MLINRARMMRTAVAMGSSLAALPQELAVEPICGRNVMGRWALARHPYRYPADAGEVRFGVITRRKRELPHERARHHDVAGTDAAAEFRELAREPYDRVERVAEDGVPGAGDDLFAIQRHPRHPPIKVQGSVRSHRRTENDRVLLGVVRQSQGDVAGEVPPRLDDLEGRMDALERIQDLLWRHLALQGAGEPHAQFRFEAGLDQIGGWFDCRRAEREGGAGHR